LSKTSAKGQGSSGTVADQVAAFIGRSMGELLNKRDSLAKQMAEVDSQIADVRQRVSKQFGSYLPATSRTARVKKAVTKKGRAAKSAARAVSDETRKKMAEAARRRWARVRAKKA
jgi:hypothetical protein